MLYLGIDQHARQITISLRNNEGDVILARQERLHRSRRVRRIAQPHTSPFSGVNWAEVCS